MNQTDFLFPSLPVPSMYCHVTLLLLRCRTLHFPLLSFMRFLSAHFCSVFRSICKTTAPSFSSSANLLRAHSVPLSRSLMKMLNSIGPHVDFWGECWHHCWLAANWTLYHLSQPSGPSCLASFLSTLLFTRLTCTLSACLWWCYGRHCQKLYWSRGKQPPPLSSWPSG